jgi:hypothetical protein
MLTKIVSIVSFIFGVLAAIFHHAGNYFSMGLFIALAAVWAYVAQVLWEEGE